MPRFAPAGAQQAAGTQHVALFEHIYGQTFEERCEPGHGLGPGQADLKNAVLWAVDPWRLGVQVGEELAAVEMSPLPFGGVVVDRKLELAGRAGEAVLPRVVDPHIDRPPSAESSTRLTSHGATRPSR